MPFNGSLAFAPDKPELEALTIRFPDAPSGAVELSTFLAYEYHEDYLTPADAWSFSVPLGALTDAQKAAIVHRARVEFAIDDNVQGVGRIGSIRTRKSRSSGTVLTIEGRSWLGPAIDGHVDPQVRFTSAMSLHDLLTAVFKPFGVKVLSTDNDANRNAITGGIFGTPTTKKGKPLKSYALHLEKPYPNEGAFGFASRVAQRFGLWIRPGVDDGTVVVARPDFDQDPRYQIVDLTSAGDEGANNVLESDVDRSSEDQPSVIVGFASGGGGEFAKSQLKAAVTNPLVAADLSSFVDAYPTVKFLSVPDVASGILTDPIVETTPRALFLYDSQAHTLAQLHAFLLRELALRLRKSLSAHYTIVGHRIGGLPVAVDTMISVNDDDQNLHLPLWVFGRRFSKTPHDGTKTTLELIRPGSLPLAPDDLDTAGKNGRGGINRGIDDVIRLTRVALGHSPDGFGDSGGLSPIASPLLLYNVS